MPAVALWTWLALTPAAADTRIVVPTLPMAPTEATKPGPGALTRAVEAPVHGMQVSIDAQGRLVYECAEAHGLPMARSHTHLVEQER